MDETNLLLSSDTLSFANHTYGFRLIIRFQNNVDRIKFCAADFEFCSNILHLPNTARGWCPLDVAQSYTSGSKLFTLQNKNIRLCRSKYARMGEHSSLIMAICVACVDSKTTTLSYSTRSIQERCIIKIINDLILLIFINLFDARTDKTQQRRQRFSFCFPRLSSFSVFINDVRLLLGFHYDIGALSSC